MKKFILTVIVLFSVILGVSITADAESFIKEGSIYWEISEHGGTGKHNTFNSINPYVTDVVIVNGYSFLDKEGYILQSKYEPQLKESIVVPIAPDKTSKIMIHIHSSTNRLGWTDLKNLETISKVTVDESQNKISPEQFVDKISEKKGTTLIYVDKSSSMDEFVRQATRAFNKLNLENKRIFVFAVVTKEITDPKKINNNFDDIGGTTDIYGSLNEANKYSPENIILITDLADNHGDELDKMSTLKTVEILCPDINYPKSELNKIKSKLNNAKITLSIIN
ncbi:MAG: hypothetical protein N2749_01845 [Clostridia bacterium]|nr:hypothetical protein [Clostridia bacterium]